MKTLGKLISICVLTVLAHTVLAQKYEGGFGYFNAGIGGHLNKSIETRLQGTTLFGNTFNFSSIGRTMGGKGFSIFSNFLIGGGGYGTTVLGNTSNGEVKLSTGGGFFNFGYLFVKKERTFMYGFGGIGGGGSTLEIKNTGTVTLDFGTNQQIPTGEKRKIKAGGFGFEAGIGVQQLIKGKGDNTSRSCFMLGLVAGINYFPAQDWRFETNDTKVSGMGNLSSFYVGITIGGGGISN
jgi:hypothetical protein